MNIRDLSLRKKLTLLLMMAAATAVLLSSVGIYGMTISHFRKAYEDDLTSLARVVANNCVGALAFRVPEDAEQVLSSLSGKPSVIQAVVRDSRGAIFAVHGRGPERGSERNDPAESSPDGTRPGGVRIVQEITLNGQALGSLTLVDDMRGLERTRLFAGLVFAASVSIAMLLSLVLARFLQRFISRPILELSSAADRISREQDPTIRAKKMGNDEVGRLVDTFNTMLDQISRRNADLIASEKRFRTLVDQGVDAFLLFDPGGRILDVNEMACGSLGYRRDELLALTIRDISSPAEGDPEAGAGAGPPWPETLLPVPVTIETRHRRKDGSAFPVEMRLGNLELGGRVFIMGVARDISERSEANRVKHKLEAQLQQAQKMEAIGVLAGGIAHDFNNILSGIIGYSELAKLKLPADSPASKDLDEVLKGGSRATDLVKQILTFSHQGDQDRSPMLVTPVVKEAIKLLRASIPSYIEIRQKIDPLCGSVLANPTQVHQIVMNLGTNAYQAMRESGGVLDITMEEIEIGRDGSDRHLPLAPGRYIVLSMSDTGHGMDRATMDRIFEPYFTTKRPGEGTGMGLSVVHGIVTRMQGHVSVYSEPGKGTSFHVYLPRSDGQAAAPAAAVAPLTGGSERILIVDDESSVLTVERELLARLGYAVTACSSPDQALAEFYRSPDSFDLVLTDMNMPGMTGAEMAREMLSVRPGLPVILCTGFSDRVDEEVTRSMGIKGFVMKPLVFTKLAASVRAALDGPQGELPSSHASPSG